MGGEIADPFILNLLSHKKSTLSVVFRLQLGLDSLLSFDILNT